MDRHSIVQTDVFGSFVEEQTSKPLNDEQDACFLDFENIWDVKQSTHYKPNLCRVSFATAVAQKTRTTENLRRNPPPRPPARLHASPCS